MKSSEQNRDGFTLIELLIAVVILARMTRVSLTAPVTSGWPFLKTAKVTWSA